MSEQPSLKVHAQFVIAFAAVLLLPAVWSLFGAIWSAATTGEVLVVSLGRTETDRAVVPWAYGWARFVGPLVLMASLVVWAMSDAAAQRVAVWWFSAALALVGLILLLYSKWFTSWRGGLWFCGMAALIASTLYVGKRFGRLAAVLFMAVFWSFVAWRVAGGPH